ncbi:MAG TPA: adenylate/guanylate cyclase domain-containing protein [Opitutaceae bacterium]
MKAWLLMPDGVQVDIGSNCQIGRAPGSAIRIDTAEVSRRHAFIHTQQSEAGTEFWLADLGSTNGTVRNGRRVTIPCRLRDGDHIDIGGVRLVFHSEETPGHAHVDEHVATTVTLQASRYCWLLMVDIKGFTTIMQTTSPEALGRTVGTWLRRTRDAIESSGGIVDKFLGDAIFAYWEAGPDTGKSVVQMLGKLQVMQNERAPDFRIVMHLGPALLAGGAGGANNISGLEVIYVFRMEKVGAALSVDSIVSEPAKQALESLMAFEPAGTHRLDGFSGEHNLYQFSKLSTTTEPHRR